MRYQSYVEKESMLKTLYIDISRKCRFLIVPQCEQYYQTKRKNLEGINFVSVTLNQHRTYMLNECVSLVKSKRGFAICSSRLG